MATTKLLINELEHALASGTEAERSQILSRITDLFVTHAPHYSLEQVDLFDEVISKLAAVIETNARAKLATKLASVPNAPTGVIRMLAFDDNIEVARPVLQQSEGLRETDLVASANTKSQQHLVAISERKSLSEAVTDALVTRGNREVVHAVAKNPGASFSYIGYRLLTKRAIGDDRLAMQIGARPDMPRQHFLQMLEVASATVRARLLAENPSVGGAVDNVIGEAEGDLRGDTRGASADYAIARAKIEALHRAGKLNEAEVCRYARERHFEETVVALSLLSGVESDLVERAMLAESDDILLTIIKLADFTSTTAKATLLLKAAGRGIAPQDLDQTLASFARLQTETARHILNFFRARSKSPAVSTAAIANG